MTVRGLHAITAVAAAVAASAALAVPATAHEFTSPQGPGETRAIGGEQEFHFRPFHVTCEVAHSVKTESLAEWPSQTLTLTVKYSKCSTHAGRVAKTEGPGIPTHFNEPVTLTYHANGYVEVGAMSIHVGGDFKCTISTEAQTIPAKALKHPEEEFMAAAFVDEEIMTESKKLPIQDVVSVNNAEVKNIHFTLEEGFCEELEQTEGKSGSYTGTLQASVPHADLSWK